LIRKMPLPLLFASKMSTGLTICLILLGLRAWPVLADESGPTPEVHLGVTATTPSRIEEPVNESSGSVTVLTLPEIEAQNPVSITEIVRDLPGVSLQESGTIGESASFSIRGTEPTQTLILLDGIRINSPFRGGFDFGNFLSDQIGQVEIVRGAQSVLYGSDAMGGVINLKTQAGTGPLESAVTAAAGNEGTYREAASIREKRSSLDYALTVSRTDTNGQFDRDRYGASDFTGRIGLPVRQTGRLEFISRVQRDRKELAVDIVPDPDPNKWNVLDVVFDENNKMGRQFSFQSLQYDDRIASILELSWKAAIVNSKLNWDKPPDLNVPTSDDYFEKTDTQSLILDLQQNIYLSDSEIITFGYEQYKEMVNSDMVSFGSLDAVDKSRSNSAYYLQNLFKIHDRFALQGGVRLDDNSSFGSVTSPKISTAYEVAATGTKVMGSWGTGFRAPTMQELYSQYGDKNLNPEKSRSWEGGVQQNIFGNRVILNVVYFRIDYRDLIQRLPTSVLQIGEARSRGIESSLKVRLHPTLSATGNYTHLDAKDIANNEELPFRPRNQGNVGLLYTPSINLIINLDINIASSQALSVIPAQFSPTGQAIPIEITRLDGSVIQGRSPGYTRVDLSATYHLFGSFMGVHETQFFIKIKNLFDREYQEVPGFPAPGINFLAGLSAFL